MTNLKLVISNGSIGKLKCDVRTSELAEKGVQLQIELQLELESELESELELELQFELELELLAPGMELHK